MSYFFTGKGIIGFKRVIDYAKRMENFSEIAQHRLKMLTFWDKHGLQASIDAFDISRRSLYDYRRRLKANGLSGLNKQSTRPKTLRTSHWDSRIIKEIKRFRKRLPNLGKEQLQVLLAPFCQSLEVACPSASTIGRLIAKAPDKMRHSPMRLDAKGKQSIFNANGFCVALNAIKHNMRGNSSG
ncbi:MAG: helix-turn-helix domain-containing protein [Ostreibacterium sp.]